LLLASVGMADAVCGCFLGSSQMRVGWSGELEPRLKFRNCVARTRGRKVMFCKSCIMTICQLKSVDELSQLKTALFANFKIFFTFSAILGPTIVQNNCSTVYRV